MYYSNEKIKSVKDIDGDTPGIIFVTSNRSAGKTTCWLKDSLENFINNGEQFILLFRYSYELNSCNEIFSDILAMYNLGKEITTISHAKGLFYELQLDGVSFGFSLSLNNVDSLKKYSPVFAKVKRVIMDEFQTESGRYLPNEIDKLQSLLMTVARGGGEQSKFVQLVLLGNFISLMNPYFIRFGIHKRYRTDTKIMRGKGWVAEFAFNESAKNAIENNKTFKAFANDKYTISSTTNEFLINTESFVEKMNGKNSYIGTIIFDGVKIGIREFYEKGILYITKKIDNSNNNILIFNANDHNQNTIMVEHHTIIYNILKRAFRDGFMRFEDLQCKNIIFDILGIDLYNI